MLIDTSYVMISNFLWPNYVGVQVPPSFSYSHQVTLYESPVAPHGVFTFYCETENLCQAGKWQGKSMQNQLHCLPDREVALDVGA